MTAGLMPWFARIPTLPSVTPVVFPDFTHDMTFFQRAVNLMAYAAFSSELFVSAADTGLLRKYTPEVSAWSELILQSEFFVVTMDHHLEWPSPTRPNTRCVPGITIRPAQALHLDIQAQPDAAAHGIIVFSFGSLGGFMPAHLTENIFKAFTGLKQSVYIRLAEVPAEADIPANL